MVDVGNEPETLREAHTETWVRILKHTPALFESGGYRNGDVIAVARVAGIQATTYISLRPAGSKGQRA